MADKLNTGIDMVEIDRIRQSISRNAEFLVRFFGVEERELFDADGANKIERIAGNFAVKEAFSKALGTGVRGFALSEVQALRNELGAPYLKLSGNALKIAEEKKLDFSISISHTNTLAIAIVIAFNSVYTK